MAGMDEHNWAGNVTYGAARRHAPTGVDELQRVVAGASRVRVLGSRHSFNDIADTDGDLVSLAALPLRFELDPDPAAPTVTVSGGTRYGELAVALHAAGYALGNLASLPHISVAGACATATHGSGVTNANLAAAQRAVELVTADGERRTVTRADADFPALAVGLGAFGAVIAVTLAVERTYNVRQVVHEHLPLAEALAHFDEIMAGAYSVSLFTTWRTDAIDQVWCKLRDDEEVPERFGARRAVRALHPVASLSAEPCTVQLAVPGPWHERLPHFRLDFTPSSGDELQSELFVDAVHGPDALRTLAGLADVLRPVVQVSEVRTVAADDLWLSPCCGRDSVAFHFTWVPSWEAVEPVLRRLEAALAPFGARPHWGKLSTMDAATLHARYPRLADAAQAMRRFDPHGCFRNAFLDRVLAV